MSNHYDPSDDRIEAEHSYGEKIKAAIAAHPARRVRGDVKSIFDDLRSIEDHVVGAKSVDALRRARDTLSDLIK